MRTKLENGLTVILKENHAAPVVAFQAWVGVGSADEAPDEAGIAHVFEHMLFKGTERRGVGAIAQEIEAAGGEINAWTSYDQTVYHLVLASRYFDTGLDILADAVQHSSFDAGELQRELKVVLEEIKQGEDNPSRVVTQALFSSAYARHPYRRPVIGQVRTVKKLTRDRLLAFFRRWYVPANMTLVVVGDFDSKRALAKIRAAWGGSGGKLAERKVYVEPPQRQPRGVVLARDVHETHVALAWHIPAIRSEDTAALDLAAIVLGQGDSSRLNLTVKRNKQLVTDVYAYSYTPRDPGLMVVGMTLPPGDPERALRAVLRELYRLAHEDISHEELAKARTIIESDTVYQKETVQGMARKLGYFDTVAGGLEFEREYLRRVQELSPTEVRQAVARYLSTANLTLAVLMPEATSARLGAAGEVRARLLAVAREEERAATDRFARAVVRPGEEGVVRRVLPNGVRVLVKRDPTVPVVAVRAVWVGGLRYETERTVGINNMLASLITRGTTTRSAEEIMREVEGMAGAIGGFSGRNSFGVRAETLARNWERGLDILADCILNPVFPEEELEKERRLVLDELRAQEDNLTSVAFRLFAETLYREHPYRFDALGTAKTVAGFTRKTLRDYYRRIFPLSGMTIAIVGDVDPVVAIEKAAGFFGGEVGEAAPPKVPREDLRNRPPGPVEVYRFLPRQQAHLVVGFPGTTIEDRDRFGLEVLATVLSGQGGRLFVELRDRKGLAYRVNAFSLEGIDPGYFAVYVACSPENLPAALDGIREELARIATEPVPAEELERAKKYLVGTHDISLQRRSALASTLAFHESYGLGYDEYRRYSAGVLAVDAAEVQRVAREYLVWDRAILATVKPQELTPGAKKRAQGVKQAPESRARKSARRGR